MGIVFEKKKTKNFSLPYLITFLSVLNQKKALHDFLNWRKHLTFGRIKDLDEDLMGHPTCLVLGLVLAVRINEIESIRHITMVRLFS